MTKPAVKITAILGAVILLAGAAFHMSALAGVKAAVAGVEPCLLYTSPSPRDQRGSRMPSSA